MKTILCSIDLSDFSRAVLYYGTELARRFDCRLIVFHSVYAASDPIHHTPIFERGGQQTAAAMAAVQSMMQRCPVGWDAHIRTGEPVAALAQAAADRQADLVVAASHGFGGLKRLLLGRVVERMVRTAAIPFLVVRGAHAAPPPEHQADPLVLRHILVGCGVTAQSRPAVEWGSRVAGRFGGTLTVLHTMESPEPKEAPADSVDGSYAQIQWRRQKWLRTQLMQLIPRREPGRGGVGTVLGQGPPAEVLLKEARRRDPDLIVVGLRRRSGIRRVLIGSTTEALLRYAPSPVLVIPEPDPPRHRRAE
jgi:nucleotide-binding universal stress UspA family protein